VINGNTTQAITDRVAATARAIASPGTTIKAVTAKTGPRVISTRAENLLGAHSVLSLAARHHAGCAAVVVAVASDTGLRAVREALPIPVTGITEAALLTACALGDGFGYLAIGRRGAGMYREVIAGYGLTTRMAAFKAIDLPPDAFLTPSDAAEPILAAVCELAEAGADTVIIGGAAFAGLGRQLQDRSPIPIVDGVSSAVRLAETLAALALPKPRSGGYAALPPRELIDVDPAIAALFKPRE
jgi:Asp/Glu/hydantoin racemase